MFGVEVWKCPIRELKRISGPRCQPLCIFLNFLTEFLESGEFGRLVPGCSLEEFLDNSEKLLLSFNQFLVARWHFGCSCCFVHGWVMSSGLTRASNSSGGTLPGFGGASRRVRWGGGAGLVFGKSKFAKAAARAGGEPANVVGDFHERRSESF